MSSFLVISPLGWLLPWLQSNLICSWDSDDSMGFYGSFMVFNGDTMIHILDIQIYVHILAKPHGRLSLAQI